jgi:hypothetical protein
MATFEAIFKTTFEEGRQEFLTGNRPGLSLLGSPCSCRSYSQAKLGFLSLGPECPRGDSWCGLERAKLAPPLGITFSPRCPSYLRHAWFAVGGNLRVALRFVLLAAHSVGGLPQDLLPTQGTPGQLHQRAGR